MPAFRVENFGCRAARADGEAIGARLRSAGWLESGPASSGTESVVADVDVLVVNTCSVTSEADKDARAWIRRAHRSHPAAKIVVTGCYAQRAPQELAAIDGVSAVVGNSHKGLAAEIAQSLVGASPAGAWLPPAQWVPVDSLLLGKASSALGEQPVPVWADARFAHSFLEEMPMAPGAQTRPNLKIQEGCGNRCTFCVIPQTRGNSRSLPADRVLRQVESFVAAGGKELVLSGINLGRWGRDLPESHPELHPASHPARREAAPATFVDLLRRILDTTGLARLRLSSIEPMDWDNDLLGLMADYGGPADAAPGGNSAAGRLARHAHLPLQSGSDAILRKMHRRYRPWHYADKARALFRAAGPDLTLGADVMVGFPGETDAQFEETLAFVRQLPFGYLHLFPFSPRPGTWGWEMHRHHPVAKAKMDERMAELNALGKEKQRTHRLGFVGRELEAITLNTPQRLTATGATLALTDNFLPVALDGASTLAANRMVRVRIQDICSTGELRGTTVAVDESRAR